MRFLRISLASSIMRMFAPVSIYPYCFALSASFIVVQVDRFRPPVKNLWEIHNSTVEELHYCPGCVVYGDFRVGLSSSQSKQDDFWDILCLFVSSSWYWSSSWFTTNEIPVWGSWWWRWWLGGACCPGNLVQCPLIWREAEPFLEVFNINKENLNRISRNSLVILP